MPGNPNSTFKPSNFKHPQKNFIQIEFILILDVWWFNNPAPLELRGPPRLGTRIPPSNPRILNTYKEIFIQIEFILILDVWWFNNPAPMELRGPPCLGTRIPPSNPWILNTYKETFIQIEFILILDVWWFNNPAPVELRGSHTWKPQFHLQTLEF
jgi:hypothetical protein